MTKIIRDTKLKNKNIGNSVGHNLNSYEQYKEFDRVRTNLTIVEEQIKQTQDEIAAIKLEFKNNNGNLHQ